MSQFSMKQYEQLIRLLGKTALLTKKETFYVALKDVAKLFDFENLLWDEEEMEFVLEDIFMDLAAITLIGKMSTKDGGREELVLEGAGVKKADYRGDGRNLFFTVDERLKYVKEFHLEADEEPEDEDEDEEE